MTEIGNLVTNWATQGREANMDRDWAHKDPKELVSRCPDCDGRLYDRRRHKCVAKSSKRPGDSRSPDAEFCRRLEDAEFIQGLTDGDRGSNWREGGE